MRILILYLELLSKNYQIFLRFLILKGLFFHYFKKFILQKLLVPMPWTIQHNQFPKRCSRAFKNIRFLWQKNTTNLPLFRSLIEIFVRKIGKLVVFFRRRNLMFLKALEHLFGNWLCSIVQGIGTNNFCKRNLLE